ncbi:MAG TPA: hypothetical protein VIM51_01055 [Desulfosporosinus sp.]
MIKIIRVFLTVSMCLLILNGCSPNVKPQTQSTSNQPNVVATTPSVGTNVAMYIANKDIDKSSFISKDKLLEKINITKDVKSNIKTVILKTWKQYSLEDDPDFKGINHQIDSDHMVWVVITEYPDRFNTKIGFYANATVTSVYDAQTGTILAAKVTGDLKG